jgi:hypothetical protein
MAVTALFLRSRPMKLGFALLLVALVPVCVIQPRGGYMLYLPLMGWALFIGPLLSMLIEGGARRAGVAFARAAIRVAAVGAAVAVVSFVHYKQLAHSIPAIHNEQGNTRRLIAQMKQQMPRMEKTARMLFINEPLAPGRGLTYLVQLAYGDPTLVVDRTKEMAHPPTAMEMTLYDIVFEDDQSGQLRLREVESAATPPVQIRFMPERVRTGEPYTVAIPEYANQSIDVSVRVSHGNSAYLSVASKWCSLDANGLATFVTPAGLQNSRVSIRKVRTGGGEWRRAAGEIAVLQ